MESAPDNSSGGTSAIVLYIEDNLSNLTLVEGEVERLEARPGDPEALDRFINTLEATRDPSHVREHTVSGWRDPR